MLKLEKTEVVGWEAAIRGMRNPMNSWEQSDSDYRPILCKRCDNCMSYRLEKWDDCEQCEVEQQTKAHDGFMIGPNDHSLMKKLRAAGTDHRKFMRMIEVYVDITAPLYWWKEYDTYKVGTVANSCSTMHKIAAKEFTLEDFSHEHLQEDSVAVLESVIHTMNVHREWYNNKALDDPKIDWWQMIQLLPSSYNQKRTVMLNYEVLANMYKSRKGHRLDEWHTFCDWIESLPYSELITGERSEDILDKCITIGNVNTISAEEIKALERYFNELAEEGYKEMITGERNVKEKRP